MLVGYGVTGVEALVLRAGIDLRRAVLQPARGWTDEQWDAAAASLVDRALLDDQGRATNAGRTVISRVEAHTDNVADMAWSDEAVTARVRETVTPLAARARSVWPDWDPIGLPR
jgi:hypothetical protein